MDFKSLISKISSMDDPIDLPKAPKLAAPIRLDEDTELRVLAGLTPLTESVIAEKAVSKSQQQAAGVALAAKREGKKPEGKGAAAEMAKMSTKELEKIAGTKHKGLPDKKTDESVEEGFDADSKVGDTFKTAKGTATKTATGVKHTRDKYDYDPGSDDKDDKKRKETARKAKKESIDPEQFKAKFSKMVEAKKAEKDDKKSKKEKKMDEAAKPDFLDVDKDGDKKEPMKKAAAEKGSDKKDSDSDSKGLSAKQKKLPPGLQKAIAAKSESKMMPKGKKRPVKESIEPKLSFKDMVRLVQESGGQQQIDPLDKELFTWASRVAANKLGEGMKSELYAGLIYERNGGRFEMYDVLSEDLKKKIDESVLNEGVLGKLKDIVMSKILPKLSDEEQEQIQSAVQQALGKSDVSMSDFTPANIKAVGKAMGASPEGAKESFDMGEGDDPFYHKDATVAEKITSMVGIVGGLASMIAAFTTGPGWLMIPGLIGLMIMSQVGTSKRGSGPAGSG